MKVNNLISYDYLVYSAPKTGGQSLSESLAKKYKIYHTHGEKFFTNKYPGQENSIELATFISDQKSKNNNFTIIGSFRFPIEMSISLFFQSSEFLLEEKIDFDNLSNEYVDKLINIFNTNILWDTEFLGMFETVPIDKINFEYNQEFYDFKHNNIRCIMVNFSNIKKWSKILKENAQIEIIESTKNLSSNKNYNKLYNSFKKRYKPPVEYLESLFDKTKFPVLHKLISPDRIQKYYNCWKYKQ
jgi:hypothetical protein